MANELVNSLRAGLAGDASEVVVGLNWTLVLGPNGLGLSHTPVRGASGCRSLPSPGAYAGRSLADLAALAESENIFERAIAFAAINAHHNRFDIEGPDLNGLDLLHGPGRNTVVIGRFPRITERLPEAAVVERDPGPDDHPESAAPGLLASADQVLMTGSTLANGTLRELLPHIPAAATVVLVGPSTPLAPRLFDLGINALSGLAVRDPDAMVRCVSEGGTVDAIRKYGRFLTLIAPGTDPAAARR